MVDEPRKASAGGATGRPNGTCGDLRSSPLLRARAQVLSLSEAIRPTAVCSAYQDKMTVGDVIYFTVLGTVRQLREIDRTLYRVRSGAV